MKKLIALVLLTGLGAACGDGGPTGVEEGDAQRGQAVFSGQFGCPACHTVQGLSTGTLGPELTHVATVAQTRRAGYSAEPYIRESILDPDEFIVPGYPGGQMPQDFGTRLSAQQLADLIAFLLTLD